MHDSSQASESSLKHSEHPSWSSSICGSPHLYNLLHSSMPSIHIASLKHTLFSLHVHCDGHCDGESLHSLNCGSLEARMNSAQSNTATHIFAHEEEKVIGQDMGTAGRKEKLKWIGSSCTARRNATVNFQIITKWSPICYCAIRNAVNSLVILREDG